MRASHDASDDLQFLRRLLRRSDTLHEPLIYLVWAAAVLGGGLVAETFPAWAGRYWLIAAPAGLATSAWLGARWQRRTGQLDAALGLRHFLHWAVLVASVGLAALMVPAGLMGSRAMGSTALLLVAVAYGLAGVHLQRGLGWIGAATAGAYLITISGVAYAWALAGALGAIALASHAFWGGARRGKEA